LWLRKEDKPEEYLVQRARESERVPGALMIVTIRGTNGSGKSTIVKRFLELPHSEIYGALGPKRPEAYFVRNLPGKQLLYVIGPYQSKTGGCDALPLSAEELVALLEKYRLRCKGGLAHHMLFEGVVISTYYGAVGEWLARNKGDVIVGFLDTPIQTCLQALGERGANRGTKNVESKIKAISSVKKHMTDAGIRTETLSRDSAFETVKDWFK
jgi:hypothetical protein